MSWPDKLLLAYEFERRGFVDILLFVYMDSCGEGFPYAVKVTIASSCTLGARDQWIQIIQPDLFAQCFKINDKIKQAKEPLEMHMKTKRQMLARFIYVSSINLSFIYLYFLSLYLSSIIKADSLSGHACSLLSFRLFFELWCIFIQYFKQYLFLYYLWLISVGHLWELLYHWKNTENPKVLVAINSLQ